MPYADHPAKLDSNEVDWHATFALLDAFARTGEVQIIFLERKFYQRLRKAGRRLGASDERIKFVIGHLKHAKGHTSHFHVRFQCAAETADCRDTK